MKIIFIGTVKSSYEKLKLLIQLKADIVGVITKKSSPFNTDHVDLSSLCKTHNIDYIYSEKSINAPPIISWIQEKKTDIIFCFGWSEIIKKDILNIPPMGVIGFHPAQLPKNRGRHPIIWALVLGLDQTASSFFFMDEGADSGDILSQETIDITYDDDANTLYNKVVNTALNQIKIFLPLLKQNTFKRRPQNPSQANTWRKRSIPDGIIDFRMSSYAIYNLIRGLTHPYCGAIIKINDTKMVVWKSEEVFNIPPNIEPGKILKIDRKNTYFIVKCSDNAIKIYSSIDQIDLLQGNYLI